MTERSRSRSKIQTLESRETEFIRSTQREIEQLRMTILHLSPKQFHDVLSSYTACESRDDWEERATTEIIQKTIPITKTPDSDYNGLRAYCPLCGAGRNDAYGQPPGYAYPEGLRRHLLGWGTARRCPVVGAVIGLATN